MALSTSITAGTTGHVADTNAVHAAVNALAGGAIGDSLIKTSGADNGFAWGGPAVRRLTASGALVVADAGGIVEYDSASAGTVTIPLESTAAFSTTSTPLVEVSQVGAGQATLAPAAASSPLMLVLAASGMKSRALGSSIFIRRRNAAQIVVPSRPTTGIRALLVGDSLTGAQGSAVTVWDETSGSALALPDAAGVGSPTVVVNAANGHKGAYFNGTTACLSLTGSWLDLFRLRSNAMVFVTYAVFGALTGDRTLVSFSTGSASTTARVLLQYRETTNGNHLAGGRRLDADTGAYTPNTGGGAPAAAPDIATLAGRYIWSSSDLYLYRNNTLLLSNTSWQTDGTTSDTASLSAAIGSNAARTAQFFEGVVLEVAVYDDNDTVRTDYHAFVKAQYGSQWVVTGDTVV